MDALRPFIRDIPDFPEPGILYRDITPLLREPRALRLAIHHLVHPFAALPLTAVAGMEARGFIFGALAAAHLGIAFVPLRKPGKLPAQVHRVAYDLEYGSAALEIHQDALAEQDRVLLIDDVLATGGTAHASAQLIRRTGAQVLGAGFLVELEALGGRGRLEAVPVHSVLRL